MLFFTVPVSMTACPMVTQSNCTRSCRTPEKRQDHKPWKIIAEVSAQNQNRFHFDTGIDANSFITNEKITGIAENRKIPHNPSFRVFCHAPLRFPVLLH